MPASIIRALIVDDEPRAIAGLRSMLAHHGDVTVVGDAANGRTAAEAIRTLEPDVLFLDIQMPGIDGLGLVDALRPELRPIIVFVTAHDDRAVEAFGVQALDYLLKPVSDRRLNESLERIREALRLRAQSYLHRNLRELLLNVDPAAGPGAEARFTARIAVRVGNRSVLVPVDDIDWIQADGFCSALHVGAKTHVIRETLLSVAARLDPASFVRVHRSSLVNVSRIVELRHRSFNALSVVLRDGTELPVSRRLRDAVLAVIGPSR